MSNKYSKRSRTNTKPKACLSKFRKKRHLKGVTASIIWSNPTPDIAGLGGLVELQLVGVNNSYQSKELMWPAAQGTWGISLQYDGSWWHLAFTFVDGNQVSQMSWWAYYPNRDPNIAIPNPTYTGPLTQNPLYPGYDFHKNVSAEAYVQPAQ